MSVTRRLAAVGAAAALSVTGLAVAAPATAVAQAAADECTTTSGSRTFEDTLITYTISQEVVGSNEVAPGGLVTYRTKVSSNSGVGGLITRITDHHPAGFTLTKATIDHPTLTGRDEADHTDSAVKEDNSVTVTGNGWSTGTGQRYVTLETTYRVPADAQVGDTFASGASTTLARLIGPRNESHNPSGVCVKVREKNVVENVTGSLDGMGLGSATGSADGGSAGSQISSDPSGFVADVINQLDLGQMLGLS